MEGQKLPLEAAPGRGEEGPFLSAIDQKSAKTSRSDPEGDGHLAGVTVGAIYQWEKGMFEPRGEKKKILVALRKLRRREARKLLEERSAEKTPKKKSRPKGKARRKAPRR